MSTDWIKEGAPVLVAYFPGGARDIQVHRSTITRVTRTQFAVGSTAPRFRRETAQTAAQQGGGFSSAHYQAYPTDDPEGLRLLKRHTRNVRLDTATNAAHRWQRQHTRENRLTLIAALNELERYDDL